MENIISIIDIEALLIASVIIFLGALTQGVIGFGLAVVATPILYIIDPDLVPGPVIIMGLAISILTLMREKEKSVFSGLHYALLGRIPGGFIGVALLLMAPKPVLGIAIASIIFLSVVLSKCQFSLVINRRSLFAAGVLSGIFSNIAAIGGPPMAMLLAGKEGSQLRSTMSAFSLFGSVIALAILSGSHLLTLEHLWISLLLLPSVFLGHFVAGTLIGRVNTEKIKSLTLLLCGSSACFLAVMSTMEILGF